MALTLRQSPALYSPAYNPQIFVFTSNQIAQPDFYYKVTVDITYYKNGSLLTYQFVDKVLQRPDGALVYDAMQKTKNFIDRSQFDLDIGLSSYCGILKGKTASIQVSVDEFYSGVLHTPTVTSYTIWDACLTSFDSNIVNYSYPSWVGDLTTGVIPLGNKVSVDERVSIQNKNCYFVHFIRSSVLYIYAELFNTSMVSVGSFTLTIDNTFNGMHYVDLGYNTWLGHALTPLDGYTVQWELQGAAFATYYSGSFTFQDICSNNRDNYPYALYYLDRAGNILHFNFELQSQQTINKKTNTVRLNPAILRGGTTYSANLEDREKHVVSTDMNKTMTLSSNWITEIQSEILEELFSSPIVWIKDSINTRWYPVTITDTSYKLNKHANESLFNYNVNVEYSIGETRQRGI